MRRNYRTDDATDPSDADKRPRIARVLMTLLVGLVVGAVAGWAGTVVFQPPADVLSASPYTYVTVVEGEVGSSITLRVAANWAPDAAGNNQAAGIVTSVAISAGDTVSQGSHLYSVNLRPVAIAQGAVPTFRSLATGASGEDVAQLQSLLAELAIYGGPIDGRFGSGTRSAVRKWQTASGVEADGVVQLGDIIFVPTLPARVSLDPKFIARGVSLSGGEVVVSALPASPDFEITVTSAQVGLMPSGTRVELNSPGGDTWNAYVTGSSPSENDEITIILAGDGGATICGDQCGQIPVTAETLVTATVHTVETVAGLVVPSAALFSAADGTVSVIDKSGKNIRVTVVTSAKGMSVVEGVEAGTTVRIPADGG